MGGLKIEGPLYMLIKGWCKLLEHVYGTITREYEIVPAQTSDIGENSIDWSDILNPVYPPLSPLTLIHVISILSNTYTCTRCNAIDTCHEILKYYITNAKISISYLT